MATTTYTKTNIWAYLSRIGISGLIGVVVVALFAGQAISGSIIGQWLGWTTFKAGPGLQYVFYILGVLLATYAIGWMNPSMDLKAGDNPFDRLFISMIIAVIVFAVALWVIPLIPGLWSVLPMKAYTNIAPFAVVHP